MTRAELRLHLEDHLTLEAEARRSIDGSAVDVACDLLGSPWAALGILVARGAAPLAEPWDRETFLEEIGLARDRLDLPALDPTEGMEDLWGWSEESELYDDAPLVPEPARAAEAAPPHGEGLERMLADKEAELARLRQELSDLHRKLDERPEKVSEPQGGASAPAPLAEDPRVARLKERVSTLRNELSQRHAERNQLRRQLERTSKRVDALEAERRAPRGPPPRTTAPTTIRTPSRTTRMSRSPSASRSSAGGFAPARKPSPIRSGDGP